MEVLCTGMTVAHTIYIFLTCSRLQTSKGDALLKSCDFIEEVLLQDFPAETFLQRPGVLKVQ